MDLKEGIGKLKEEKEPKGPLAIGCGSFPWCKVGTQHPPELKHFVYNNNNNNNNNNTVEPQYLALR